jgi:hypothetical protein
MNRVETTDPEPETTMTQSVKYTTSSEIRDYTTGCVIGWAEVADETLAAYEGQEIGQWPEGILAASDLLSDAEIDRLGIEANRTVWIEV